MRIIIQAVVEGAGDSTAHGVTIGVIERVANAAPDSGLGLYLGESHEILRSLQSVILREQASQFVDAASRCGGCSGRLTTKDTKTVVYRTAFGKAHLPSPRLYSRCALCGTAASGGKTFSPLALALPERTHPQWSWLQSRYASVLSYRLAQIFLRDAFGADNALPASSIKVHVRAVGDRLEREAQSSVAKLIDGVADLHKPVDSKQVAVALQIDAGYIRAAPRTDGARWMAAVAPVLGRHFPQKWLSFRSAPTADER